MNQLMVKYGIDFNTLFNVFKSHLENEGIVFDRESDFSLEKSSKRIYLRTNHHNDATKNKKKTAWYIVDIDNARMSYGWFHAGGASFTYSLFEYIQEMNLQPGDIVYSKEQQEEDLKRYLNSCKRAEKSRIEKEVTAIIYMGLEWSRSLDLPQRPHNYIVKKQIQYPHARLYNPVNFSKPELLDYIEKHHPEYKNNSLLVNRILDLQPDITQQNLRLNKLLVEGVKLDNQVVFLQTIAEHKNKKGEDKFSLRGVLPNGAFKILFNGDLALWDLSRFIFCEGYATGEAIAEAINYSIPVIVVYTAGNILNVVRDFRAQYPFSRFYIFNDNDLKTASESKIGRNPGVYYAIEASKCVNASLIGPDFTNDEIDSSDWCDFKCLYGVEHTRNVIRHKMKSAVPITAIQSPINPNYSINALFFNTDQLLENLRIYPESMTKQHWSTLVLKAYSQLTQEGFSQIHPIEVVKDRYLQILGQLAKQRRSVTPSNQDQELTLTFTRLVSLCARNESTTELNDAVFSYIRAYQKTGLELEKIKDSVQDILSGFYDAGWSYNFVKNIFDSFE